MIRLDIWKVGWVRSNNNKVNILKTCLLSLLGLVAALGSSISMNSDPLGVSFGWHVVSCLVVLLVLRVILLCERLAKKRYQGRCPMGNFSVEDR